MNNLIYTCIFLLCICSGRCQDEDTNVTLPDSGGGGLVNYRPNDTYCYRFTWLGPEYDDSSSGYNSSCSEYLDEKNCGTKGCGVPCRTPFVITNDSTMPDMDWLWNQQELRPAVLCQMRKGQSCVRYSYLFDGVVQNITYMCTKVQDLDSGPITNDFISYDINGYTIEMKVCQSREGMKPCNSAHFTHLSTGVLLISLSWFYYVFVGYLQ